MPNMRVLPPVTNAGNNPIIVNGRSYSAAAGTYLDVPTEDGALLCANGWHPALTRGAQVGPATARPAAPGAAPFYWSDKAPRIFIDTTLGAVVVWDGASWRNVLTGAAA